MTEKKELVGMTVDIVSAYVLHNTISPDEVYIMIEQVHKTLQKSIQFNLNKETTLVSVNQSVFPDYIICLEDGKKFKSLKRHLKTKYNLSPEEYREKWQLPANYPMVAPNYAKARSALAKKMGLGKMKSEK